MDNPAFDATENNTDINCVTRQHNNLSNSQHQPTLKHSDNDNDKSFKSVPQNGTGSKCTVKNDTIKPENEKDKKSHSIKRQVGFLGSVSLVLGTMIGSVWLSIIVWAFCGLISTFGAISFIELSTVVPSKGAEYAYLLKAFGHLPAFLFAWASTIVLKPASVAIGCLAVAEYSIEPFVSNISDVPWACKLLSIVYIFVLTFINCYSVKIATQIQVVFTVTKLLAFGIIIGGGIVNICNGKTDHLKFTFEGSNDNYGKLAIGMFQGIWNFDAWSQLVETHVTEEIKDPSKHLPAAIMLGLTMITVLYILINIAYLTLLTPYEIAHTNFVTTLYGKRLLGSFSFLMPIVVILSTFGTAFGIEFAAARLSYVAARDGHLVDFLSFVDLQRQTPSLALIFNSLIAIIMTLIFDLQTLIQFFCFTASLFYGAGVAALIRLRHKEPDAPRPFKVPIIIPYFTVLVSIYLAIAPLVEDTRMEYIYSIIILTIGLIFYFPFVHFKWNFNGMITVNRSLQILFMTVPSTWKDVKTEVEKLPSTKPKKMAGDLELPKNSNIQITRL